MHIQGGSSRPRCPCRCCCVYIGNNEESGGHRSLSDRQNVPRSINRLHMNSICHLKISSFCFISVYFLFLFIVSLTLPLTEPQSQTVVLIWLMWSCVKRCHTVNELLFTDCLCVCLFIRGAQSVKWTLRTLFCLLTCSFIKLTSIN